MERLGGGQERSPGRLSPPQDPGVPIPTAPSSFRDTLSAILGRQINVRSLPSLGESAALTNRFAPSTILVEDDRAEDRSVMSHELGHLIDFANVLDSEDRVKELLEQEDLTEEEKNRLVANRGIREAAYRLGLLREDPVVTEQFADEFEGALLDPEVRGAEPDEVRRRLQNMIDERLERFQRRQRAKTRTVRDATAIRR